MEDGAKENTALNIQKPLEILVTDEDKHGTDIACMSDFFGIYIEQLSAELSNQVMRGVVEKIPAADVQILGELVHGVDVLLSGKYGYIPDFDSLPNDVKDKLKKGIYTLGESRQVEDNVRAVVLDENGTRIKDVTLKRVLNTPDAGQADDDLYELAQYIKTNGHSKITEKHISSRALGIQPFSTATENAFLENLTHALENIWLSQSKYVIHKEVAISQVFRDNITYDDLFYMGRFDFVVYEKQGRSELPILAIELDGKEHFEDAVVKERDRKKNAICKAHNMEIIRVENSYARRYNHIKGILMDYFSRVH